MRTVLVYGQETTPPSVHPAPPTAPCACPRMFIAPSTGDTGTVGTTVTPRAACGRERVRRRTWLGGLGGAGRARYCRRWALSGSGMYEGWGAERVSCASSVLYSCLAAGCASGYPTQPGSGAQHTCCVLSRAPSFGGRHPRYTVRLLQRGEGDRSPGDQPCPTDQGQGLSCAARFAARRRVLDAPRPAA